MVTNNEKEIKTMRTRILVMAMALLMMAPASLLAMSHGDHSNMDEDKATHGEKMSNEKMNEMGHENMKKMDHGKMEGMDHDGMGMQGDMMMLGDMTVEGVQARAHLKDVGEAMAKMGMDQTHHIMVSFVKDGNGAEGLPIEKGRVAVKIINPDESEREPIKMMGMQGHFGADITLKEKGLYHFYIGTKFEDGTKRKYHFHTVIE